MCPPPTLLRYMQVDRRVLSIRADRPTGLVLTGNFELHIRKFSGDHGEVTPTTSSFVNDGVASPTPGLRTQSSLHHSEPRARPRCSWHKTLAS